MSDWPDRGAVEPVYVVTEQTWPQAPHPQAPYAQAPHAQAGYPPHGGAPVPTEGAGQAQVIDHIGHGGGDSPYASFTPPPESRPRWRRRIIRAVLVLVAILIATPLGTYVWADTKLNHDVDLGSIPDRPAPGEGTNYLIVGSDSREGLSTQDKKDLHTGSADGRRTDSVILLHTGANGTTMMSLPRDSWVTIPPFVQPDTGVHHRAKGNKLNAAFSMDGPELLVRTVEQNTGLRIDHYAEMGFAGFVGIVDAVGGVDMCLERAVKDEKSGADLKKGCQTLDGTEALAFVRQRHQESEGDLGRTQNQQKFLAALADKAATSDVLLAPEKIYATAGAGLDTLIVDNDTGLRDLASLFRAMQSVTSGNGKRINVPVANPAYRTSKGVAVKWDEAKTQKLFTELRNDEPVTIEEKT